ncbi:MAG TPA: hypothetical protein VNY10_07560 [Roseiarcus sp.]|nr:hypothetical protein [Roseiarcus sp.]
MSMTKIIVGLLVAFLLFTPQGRTIDELAFLTVVSAGLPAPDPAVAAAHREACEAIARAYKTHDGPYVPYEPGC